MAVVKNALKQHFFAEEVKTVKQVNGLLYYLKKVPLIGKTIPVDVYKFPELKRILFILMSIWRLGLSLAMKFLWPLIGAGIYIGIRWFIYSNGSFDFFSHFPRAAYIGLLVWMLGCIAFAIFYATTPTLDHNQIKFIEHFRLSKSFYVRADVLINAIKHTILYLPASIIIGFLLGQPLLFTFFIPIFYLSTNVFGLVLSRFINNPKKSTEVSVTGVRLFLGLLVIAFIAVLALPFFFELAWLSRVFNFWLVPLFLVLGVLFLYQLLTFKGESDYVLMVVEKTNVFNLMAEDWQAEEAKKFQEQSLEDAELEETAKQSEKSGSEFLNDLLFRRHKRMFDKSLRWRMLWTLTGVVVFLVLTFWPNGYDYYAYYDSVAADEIVGMFVMLAFAYFAWFSLGRNLVKVVFLNCDLALLRYPFYRQRDVIWRSFWARFKWIFKYNLILIVLPILIILLVMMEYDLMTVLPYLAWAFFALISLLATVSFHDLFLYYILQPYVENMETKSPLFSIINALGGVVIWIPIWDDLYASVIPVAIIAIVVTTLYIGIGSWALRKYGSKTFRLKG